mgnify:CR=1 FL=1
MIDWPAIAKRYGYSADVVPERPWWRSAPNGHGPGWQRTDGLTARGSSGEPISAFGRECLGPWFASGAQILAYLDTHDLAHPLPAPEPACGQVWIYPLGMEALLFAVCEAEGPGGAYTDIKRNEPGRITHHRGTDEWPPPGAVLVAGRVQGAPVARDAVLVGAHVGPLGVVPSLRDVDTRHRADVAGGVVVRHTGDTALRAVDDAHGVTGAADVSATTFAARGARGASPRPARFQDHPGVTVAGGAHSRWNQKKP